VHRGCGVYAAISCCQAGHKGTARPHSQCEIARQRVTDHLLRASRAMGFVGMRLLGGFPTLTPSSSVVNARSNGTLTAASFAFRVLRRMAQTEVTSSQRDNRSWISPAG
jgi:hypothetical protein